ncbi:MAG: response regulator [Nitrosopumilales archaeon]|nr:response regulator [Nitrosopumilales archaeon]
MRILIAEDDTDISESYKDALEARNHIVMLAENGEECLELYNKELKREQTEIENGERRGTPFDAVILDYMMPRKDGMQVAKEILEINPKQRIIFASAYVEETLEDTVKQLKQVVELMQKPFGADALVNTIEDKEIYEGLKQIMLNLKQIKDANPSPKQLKSLLESLKKIQKGRTF